MATDPVMTTVERELKAKPDLSSSDLHAKLSKKHAAVRKLSVRQFHARYPLRVKKRWSLEMGGKRSKKRTGRAKVNARPRVSRRAAGQPTRDVLVQFANELLQMPDAPFTTVLARVEHYAGMIEN